MAPPRRRLFCVVTHSYFCFCCGWIDFSRVVKREEGRAPQTFLNGHSWKLKQLIWNAALTWKFCNRKIKLAVTTAADGVYNVEIGETTSSTCEYDSNPRKIKHMCKRIAWVLLKCLLPLLKQISSLINKSTKVNLVSLVMQDQISSSQCLRSKWYLTQKVKVFKDGMRINYWQEKRQSVARVLAQCLLRNCTYLSMVSRFLPVRILPRNTLFNSENHKRWKEFVTLLWLTNQMITIGKTFIFSKSCSSL